jgi:hypothetical protein
MVERDALVDDGEVAGDAREELAHALRPPRGEDETRVLIALLKQMDDRQQDGLGADVAHAAGAR